MKRRGVDSARFRRDTRRMERRGKDLGKLDRVMDALEAGEKLPDRLRDHALIGNMRGKRECHLEPNWLLVYKLEGDDEGDPRVVYERTGTHSEVLGM